MNRALTIITAAALTAALLLAFTVARENCLRDPVTMNPVEACR